MEKDLDYYLNLDWTLVEGQDLDFNGNVYHYIESSRRSYICQSFYFIYRFCHKVSSFFKFYNHLTTQIERYFEIKNRGFEYSNGKTAKYFFIVKSKGEIISNGPNANDKFNVDAFKKNHKKTFVSKGRN